MNGVATSSVSGVERTAQGLVLGRERARDDAEVGDQVLERELVSPQRPHDGVEATDHALQVSRLLAEQRLVDLRRVLEGGRRGPVELAESLRPAELDQGVAELVEEDLEIAADVALKRGQDLVERDRVGGLVDREGEAVVGLGRVRRARLEI